MHAAAARAIGAPVAAALRWVAVAFPSDRVYTPSSPTLKLALEKSPKAIAYPKF